MLNPKDALEAIKTLLSKEEAPVEVAVLAEEVEEKVEDSNLEEDVQDEFVTVAVFNEAISMLLTEIEALKGGSEEAPEEAPAEELSKEEVIEEVKEEVKEELSAEVVAEEVTELHVHNPEVQQVKLNTNRPLTSKQSVWNIINNK